MPADALALARSRLGSLRERVALELDEEEFLSAFVRRDMLHLDADALHDRLHHWTVREVHPTLPHAFASVSFRRALPADPLAESELDLQEGWLGLEPTLRLESPRPSQEEVATFVSLLPRFLDLLEGRGRPAGWRRVDEGAQE